MSADLSLLKLVLNASPVVQAVMLLLIMASLISWTMIFDKWRTLRRAFREADNFEDRFWSGVDLGKLYKQITSIDQEPAGMEEIFEAGFRQFTRLHSQPGVEPRAMVEGSQRGMRVALTRETEDLEQHLSFLGTVGSTSPYVGLFGTVWGIMNSFRALGAVQQPTMANVAPGIAEALIATAMGLLAAIPAVIAYNRYVNDVERLANRYETFMEEFSTILQRQSHL
jgi:biopolymer transport protein TolQ